MNLVVSGPVTKRTGKGPNTTLDDGALVTHALTSEGFDASEDGTGRGTPLVPTEAMVRRLSPVECERLQSFPDNWTAIDGPGEYVQTANGWRCVKGTPDAPRYSAMGDAVTVNAAEWIGRRLARESQPSGAHW